MKVLCSTLKILRSILLFLVFSMAVVAALSGFLEAATYTGPDVPVTALVVGAVGAAVVCTMVFIFAARNLGERIQYPPEE